MKEMENKVRRAFEHATPNVLDSVLSDCREQKGTIVMTQKNRNWSKKLLAVAAALVLVIGLGAGYGWYSYNNTPLAAISLDVNPSIQITVNRNEKVLDVDALNKDAEIVLGDMDLEGSDINVAVNAILGSMLRNGYLTADANTILVSVNSKDAAMGAALQKKLNAEIGKILSGSNFSGAVMSQTVTDEETLRSLADEHDISVGKAQLIQKILAADNHYVFADLAKLSVNELKLLTETPNIKLDDVTTNGQASSTQFIEKDAALNAALAHIGATKDQVRDISVEFDCDDGRMVYEVDFDLGEYDYEFDIDARTGEVLHMDKEMDDDYTDDDDQPIVTPDTYISPERAKAAALAHAGLKAADVRDLECELDADDGTVHYDVDFETAQYEYEYEIDATTGEVLLSRRENQDDD